MLLSPHVTPVAMAAGLRILVVVGHAGLHLEEQHHGVIFVHGVVAVHGPVPLEVAEAEEECGVLVELKPRDILARDLYVGDAGPGGADAASTPAERAVTRGVVIGAAAAAVTASVDDPAQNLVFFKMDVNRVLPVIPRISQDPVLRAVLGDGEAQLVTVGEPVVDDPLAVVAVEDEVARDARRDDARQ